MTPTRDVRVDVDPLGGAPGVAMVGVSGGVVWADRPTTVTMLKGSTGRVERNDDLSLFVLTY